jgi:predicted phosphoribosyltransferase
VAARETVALIEREADTVVCLHTPEFLGAIGLYYRDFAQVSDEEVSAILARFRHGAADA